jgi:mannose-6-phosphate isomerase-like protein (cupin superfamily)
MEAVYYVVAGSGTAVDPDGTDTFDVIEGSMIHVEPGTRYEFQAGEDGIEILGGPCPADHALYNGIPGQ